jgi:hypothetical protein
VTDLARRPAVDRHAATGAPDEPHRAVRYALVALVLLPIAVAVVRALRHDWFPIGDSALLYIRGRDVLTSHHPLLGSWTSASMSVGENMNNPGALYDDLVAPTSRLLPFSSAAAIGVGLVNAATVVGIAGAARAIGGWAMQRWMLVACAALTWIMGSELLIDIWQAHALLLPFLAYLVLMIGIADGQARWVPWAAGVASLLVQTHISYIYVLTVVTAAAVVVAASNHWPVPWREWRAALRSRVTLLTLVVVLVCWAQPIWEQLFGAGRGNMVRLLTNASGGDTKLGLGLGARFSAVALLSPVWRLRSGFSSLIPNAGTSQGPDGPFVELTRPLLGAVPAAFALAALVGVLALLAVVLRRQGSRSASSACWLAASLVAAAPLCLSLVTVGVFFAPHHVRWLWAFGAFLDVTIVWAILEVVVHRVRRLERAAAVAPLVLVVGLSVAAVPFHAQQQGPVSDYWSMPAMRRLFRELEPLRDSAPVVYDISSVRVFEPYSSAIMMRLQELGIEFRTTDEGMVRQLGDARRADGTERTRLFQLEGRFAIDYLGDACRIAIASSLDPAEEVAASREADAIVAGIVDGSIRIDVDAVPPSATEAARAAAGGDPAAARALVLDRTIGADVLSGDADLASRVALVQEWAATTIALYADDPVTCPTA